MSTPFGLPYPRRVSPPPRVVRQYDPHQQREVYRPGWWEIGVGESGLGKLPTSTNLYGVLYRYISAPSVVITIYGWVSWFGVAGVGFGAGFGGRSLEYLTSILTPEVEEPDEDADEEEAEAEVEMSRAEIMEQYDPHWFGRTVAREVALERLAPWARSDADRTGWLDELGALLGYNITECLRIQIVPASNRGSHHKRPEYE